MSRVKYFFSLICALVLVSACSEIKDELEIFKDDVDFDANDRTADVTRENMEQIALGAIQASYLTSVQLPLFQVLDASDFPSVSCSSGQVTLDATRGAGESHRSGDRVTVTYENCVRADGAVLDGEARFVYGAIRGLNKTFQRVDSQVCIDSVGSELGDANIELVENESGGEYFLSDAATFRKVQMPNGAVNLEVDFLRLESVPETENEVYTVVATRSLPDKAVVAVRSLEVDTVRSTPSQTFYQLRPGTYPSLDGDILFEVNGEEYNQVRCQEYDRTLTASLNDFSITPSSDLKIVMDGTATLFEATRDFDSFTESVLSSSFSVEYLQLNRRSIFDLKGVDIDLVKSDSQRTMNYAVNGLLSSAEVAGTVELQTQVKIRAQYDDFLPLQGNLDVLGREFEKVDIVFDGVQLDVNADVDGDTDNNGQSDIDTFVETFWQDLLNRDFVLGAIE